MARLHVAPLRHIADVVRATGARDLVSLINVGTPIERPAAITRHLLIGVSDVAEPREGHVAPGRTHVAALLAFVRGWDRAAPLLIHCWAGVSRSTAAAFITACALDPARAECAIAAQLRAASPTATPNPRLVAVADAMLGRQGRMGAAVAQIGRGTACFEGAPFALDI